MAKKRITELATETTLKDGQYVAIDHATDGTKKYDFGGALTDLKEELENISGISDDVKVALLQIASKVAYIDDDGQDYYDALYDALYPPADLVSISAVYTQSGAVYDTDSLDSLKSDLVVTAHYSDQTTQTVTSYTLSGTLEVGTSTITVTYAEKTTTFTVIVSEIVPLYPFVTGTHSFTSPPGNIASSNGNTIVAELLTGNNNDMFANLSDVTNNGTAVNNSTNIRNGGNTWITLQAGDVVTLKATVTQVEKGTDNSKFSIFLPQPQTPSTSVSVIGDTLLKNLTVGSTVENTVTIESATNIACVGFFFGSRNSSSVSASIGLAFEIYVNGIKYV